MAQRHQRGWLKTENCDLTHTAHAALAIFTIGSGIRTRLGCPDFASVASTRTTWSDMTIGSLTNSNTCPYSLI